MSNQGDSPTRSSPKAQQFPVSSGEREVLLVKVVITLKYQSSEQREVEGEGRSKVIGDDNVSHRILCCGGRGLASLWRGAIRDHPR